MKSNAKRIPNSEIVWFHSCVSLAHSLIDINQRRCFVLCARRAHFRFVLFYAELNKIARIKIALNFQTHTIRVEYELLSLSWHGSYFNWQRVEKKVFFSDLLAFYILNLFSAILFRQKKRSKKCPRNKGKEKLNCLYSFAPFRF